MKRRIFTAVVAIVTSTMVSCRPAEDKKKSETMKIDEKVIFSMIYVKGYGGQKLYDSVFPKPIPRRDDYCLLLDNKKKTISIAYQPNRDDIRTIPFTELKPGLLKTEKGFYLYILPQERYDEKTNEWVIVPHYYGIFISEGPATIPVEKMNFNANGDSNTFCYKENLCGMEGCLQLMEDSYNEYLKNKHIYDNQNP